MQKTLLTSAAIAVMLAAVGAVHLAYKHRQKPAPEVPEEGYDLPYGPNVYRPGPPRLGDPR